MNTTSIQTIQNRVTKRDDEGMTRNRQLADRGEEVASYGRHGYALVHTAVIEGPSTSPSSTP